MSVAVVGAYGVGMTFAVTRLPDRGETIVSHGLSVSHGGKGSNQAVGVARLGFGVDLLTCVGLDSSGAGALDMWRDEGVGATVVRVADATMTGVIFVEPDGDNRIVIEPGAAARLSVVDVEKFAPHIAAADICLVSLEIPVGVAVHALEVARRVGTRTVLNPAPAPQRPLSDDELGLVDYLTPNLGELHALAGGQPGSAAEAIDALRGRYPGTIVATLGSAGACIADGRGLRIVPAFAPHRVLDTTGAGDAFNAALAVTLARGAGVDEAVRRANAAAAHSIGVREVLPSLARSADIDQIIDGQVPPGAVLQRSSRPGGQTKTGNLT